MNRQRTVLFCSIALAVMIGLAGCWETTPKVPPPSDVASAGKLAAASAEQQSRAAAAVQAAATANEQNPAGNPKEAVRGELSVASSNLPEPSDKDRADALARANLALSGKLTEAEAKWSAARDEAAALKSRIAELERQVVREREQAAAELQRQLREARDKAKREADAKMRAIQTWILFGGAALCAIGAGLVGTLGSQIPLFGPRAAIGLGIASAFLFGLGMAMRLIERMIDEHPYVFWGGLLFAVLAVIGSAVLVYSNHLHAKESTP